MKIQAKRVAASTETAASNNDANAGLTETAETAANTETATTSTVSEPAKEAQPAKKIARGIGFVVYKKGVYICYGREVLAGAVKSFIERSL